MNTAILVIWTLVGFTGTSSSVWERKDWRPIGEFATVEACDEAARQLGFPKYDNRYRCLDKGGKK